MTKRTPHKHSAAIHAFADGCEIEYKSPFENSVWTDCVCDPSWNLEFEYRAKPPPVMAWYRVAATKILAGSPSVCIVKDDQEEESISESKYFSRWLTDRIEYEVTQ